VQNHLGLVGVKSISYIYLHVFLSFRDQYTYKIHTYKQGVDKVHFPTELDEGNQIAEKLHSMKVVHKRKLAKLLLYSYIFKNQQSNCWDSLQYKDSGM
jgi:hypothetical protein